MSLSVAILSPNPADESFNSRWRDVLERMTVPLVAEGISVHSRSWTQDGGELGEFDLVLPLVAWGYHRDHADWLTTLDGWAFEGVRVQNPASVLRWNSDKQYLERLVRLGAPVIPTLFVDDLQPADLDEAAAAFGTDELIVKPQISSGAYKTLRVRPGGNIEEGPLGPAMIQPFLDQVSGEGELSLLYFNGEFSHGVRKIAAAGDFRTQPDWGGLVSDYQPEPDVLAAAARVLQAVEEPLLYARVDLVRDAAGKPQLMELELVEPDLYLGYEPEAAGRFARAVRLAAEA